METQEALSDVARLQKALAESKDANKSAADVAEAESKIVDELRGKLLGLETAKETLELKLKTAGAEANGEADMRADASADKRAARDDLATAKETIESLRHELDAAPPPATKRNAPRLRSTGNSSSSPPKSTAFVSDLERPRRSVRRRGTPRRLRGAARRLRREPRSRCDRARRVEGKRG